MKLSNKVNCHKFVVYVEAIKVRIIRIPLLWNYKKATILL